MKIGDSVIFGSDKMLDVPCTIVGIGAPRPHPEAPDCTSIKVQCKVDSGEHAGEEFLCENGELITMKQFEQVLASPPFWRIYAKHLVWGQDNGDNVVRVIGHLEAFIEEKGLRGEFEQFLQKHYPEDNQCI